MSNCADEKNANQFALSIHLPRALWLQSEQRARIQCKFDWIRHIVCTKWQHLSGKELKMYFIRLIYTIILRASVSVVTRYIDKLNDVEIRSHLDLSLHRSIQGQSEGTLPTTYAFEVPKYCLFLLSVLISFKCRTIYKYIRMVTSTLISVVIISKAIFYSIPAVYLHL